MALLSTVYCTIVELQRYMSSNATTDFADHDDDGSADTDVIEDCINEATQELDLWLIQSYEASSLSSSELITRWCVVLSAVYLTQRRGNVTPFSFQSQYDRIQDHIRGIAAETQQLPGVERRGEPRPTVSNIIVDRRYRSSTIRVTVPNSSDAATTMTQDRDRTYYGQFE